jgi:hypothetical protein
MPNNELPEVAGLFLLHLGVAGVIEAVDGVSRSSVFERHVDSVCAPMIVRIVQPRVADISRVLRTIASVVIVGAMKLAERKEWCSKTWTACSSLQVTTRDGAKLATLQRWIDKETMNHMAAIQFLGDVIELLRWAEMLVASSFDMGSAQDFMARVSAVTNEGSYARASAAANAEVLAVGAWFHVYLTSGEGLQA